VRTTLNIEPDILQAAKEIAAKEKTTAGAVLSRLAKRGLAAPASATSPPLKIRNGIPVIPARGRVITLEHVRRILDEEGV